ncbi:MAG: S1 RNA-binding domain-containing protein [Cyanobacteria bacterium]|nr:S1 RNA-binding domain-containing protein [Cyanobacteriota bacterium]
MDSASERTTSSKKQPEFSTDDFARALEAENSQFQVGQVVRGVVTSYESDGAYVDIRGKSAAFVPIDEASLQPFRQLAEVLPLEVEHDFLIIREQNDDGQVTLSRRQLQIRQQWLRFATMQANRETIAVRVTGTNKGGLTVDAMGMRGFIPRSHLTQSSTLDTLKGKTLTVAFLEVDANNRRLVLSEKQANRAASFSQLEVGQVIQGTITNIKPFGVFVDFAGTSGLLHINQVSKTYVSNLEEVFHAGQTIKAVILDLDEGRGRISLSTKVLENFPGEILQQMAEVMDNAEVRAQKIRQQIADGVQG